MFLGKKMYFTQQKILTSKIKIIQIINKSTPTTPNDVWTVNFYLNGSVNLIIKQIIDTLLVRI